MRGASFEPTLYTRESVLAELESAKNDPEASKRSRVSVLLAKRNFEQKMTITHTLWTMFGVISPGKRQLPHRHQSVALDFVVDAQPGVYTLLGPDLNPDEHVDESGADPYVMPVQEAGLHTYLRTLDIRFCQEDCLRFDRNEIRSGVSGPDTRGSV